MKKIILYFSVFVIIILFIIELFVVESPFDKSYKKNTIGNNTNNIRNGGEFAMQGDWVYYYRIGENIFDPTGLYRQKKDGSQKTFIDSGEILDINVVGEWVYYIKMQEKDYMLYYFDMYKIKLDGSNKKKLLNDVKNLNVINGKIIYEISLEYLGPLEEKKIRFPKEKIGDIIVCDIDLKECETVITRQGKVGFILVDKNFIYYRFNGMLYRYSLLSKKSEYIFKIPIDCKDFYLYNDCFYYSDGNKIYEYNINNKTIDVLVDHVEHFIWLSVVDDKLFYKESLTGNPYISIVNLNNKEKYKIKGGFSKIYNFDNYPYVMDNDALIKLKY